MGNRKPTVAGRPKRGMLAANLERRSPILAVRLACVGFTLGATACAAPMITLPPQSTTVTAGHTATFSVSSDGSRAWLIFGLLNRNRSRGLPVSSMTF